MPTKRKKKAAPRGRAFPKGVSGNPSGKNQYSKPVAPIEPAGADPSARDNTDELLGLIDRLLSLATCQDVRRTLERRRRVLVWCRGDRSRQERVWRWCRGSIRLYVDLFVWQYNPTKRGDEVGPFVLWDFQRDALARMQACYEEGRSCVIEKSREMGASWLLLIMQDWYCRFHEWQKWLDVSRSADAVDAPGDSDSLFWKLDFIHEHLPAFLQGERKQGKERKKFHIHYARSRSTITGQASTGKAGVGGRASAIVIDEFSLIEEDRQVRQRTASTGRSRFFNGTHQGTGTEFYRLAQTPEITKIVMHWSQHPDKNKGLYRYDLENHKLLFFEYVPGSGLVELGGPAIEYPGGFEFVLDGSPTGGPHPGLRSPWYDAKSREIGTSHAVAQELDIDPKASKSKPFDPLLIHHLKQQCRPPSWEGDVEYTSRGEFVRLVEGKGGPLKLWFRPIDGRAPRGAFVGGSDVSGGTGATPSCLSMGNAQTGEKVLRYRNAHISPDKFGHLAAALCRWLGEARIAWEHAGPGTQFAKGLREEAGYANTYRMGEEDRKARVGPRPPGFVPSGTSKNAILRNYNLALRNGEFCNYDEEALDETLEFQYDASGKITHAGEVGADPSVARENHGDDVIADALCNLLMQSAGMLASRQPPESPAVPPAQNIMTMEGRRAAREKRQREEQWA